MAKVFRLLLLSATNGGKRYIRALFSFVVGLTTRATTAPGVAMKARATVEIPKGKVTLVTRSMTDIRCNGLVGSIQMSVRMIAKLVSSLTFRGRVEVATVRSDLSMAMSSVMRGMYRIAVGLNAGIKTGTGVNIKTSNACNIGMRSKLNTTSPEKMVTALETVEEVSARGTAAKANSAKAHMEAEQSFLANVKPSTAADLGGAPFRAEIGLKARLMTWVFPERVGEKTLYIPQVYETEREGNVLILK